MSGAAILSEPVCRDGASRPAALYSTARLDLLPAFPAAFEPLYARVFAQADVMQHAFMGKTFERGEAERFFMEQLDHAGDGRRPGVLVERATGRLVGMAGLIACEVLGASDFEIGFVLAQEAWGKGYATEIGCAQLDFGFARLGCARLLAQVAPRNRASRAVLEKLDMVLHATLESPGRGTRLVYVKARDERLDAH